MENIYFNGLPSFHLPALGPRRTFLGEKTLNLLAKPLHHEDRVQIIYIFLRVYHENVSSQDFNSFKKNKNQIFRAWLIETNLLMLIYFIDLKGIQHGNKGH